MLRKGQIGRSEPAEELEGSVERVTFHSEESGFSVLRVKARGHREQVTIVGNMAHVVPGEWVKASGEWTTDRDHGRQFKAAQLESTPPDSLEGIEKFLGSGLIKGIGPVYASKIVQKFGKEVFDVIEHQSAALEKVEGIGTVRRQRIKQSWCEAREVRSIMAFLMSNGVSTARAFRIYKTYGDQAIEKVRENPYCLARDIRGIGFKIADQIAGNMGIAKDSDLRARAGIEYVLMQLTQQGHCAYAHQGLLEEAVKILEIGEEIVAQAIDHGLEENRLVQDPSGLDEPLIYLFHLYQAESELAVLLKRLASGTHPCPQIDVQKALAWAEKKVGLELAPAQARAVIAGLRDKVMIITGGPGVGKTTMINTLIKILSAKKIRVVLGAPTGRAAKRMAEATGMEARTIHRLLAFDPKAGKFKHDEHHPLSGDVFIFDEASMIDLPLAWQLVRAIPKHGALVWVGDIDQLPSVGPGTVLRDIIRSEQFTVIQLNEVFRQAAMSDIISNAHRINQGAYPHLGAPGSRSDFFLVEAEAPEKAVDLIVKLVKQSIPSTFGLDPRKDIQVLTPMQRGLLGARNLNDALQHSLNPSGSTIERFGFAFRSGDKVMQIENNYDKDVFNGDIGSVSSVDEVNRELSVRYGTRTVTYDFQELDELVPAYAITIHKSQGSEYPCVVIPVHTQHYIMLQRNLIYTAVTRGRKLVVLVGTPKALAMAVRNADTRQRVSALEWRLRQAPEYGSRTPTPPAG